jgi:hypothetical protein
MSVNTAIRAAEKLLPGVAAADDASDPRWQAIIEVAEFVEDEPEAVWRFVERWGRHSDKDLQSAIATCLLEHLLEHHFKSVFPRVEALAKHNPEFASTFSKCAQFGQSEAPGNAAKFARLKKHCERAS